MLAFNSIELMACNGVIIIATPNITAVIAFALRPWPHEHKFFLKTKTCSDLWEKTPFRVEIIGNSFQFER